MESEVAMGGKLRLRPRTIGSLAVAVSIVACCMVLVAPFAQADNLIPDLSNPAYTTSNPFHNLGYGGQCTWFAWGRTLEKLGIALGSPFRGGAGTWWNEGVYPKGSTPEANSIAVWSGGSYGHVAFVEAVDASGDITINEANWDKYQNTNWGGGYDGAPETLTPAQWRNKEGSGYMILGFIYLPGSQPAWPPPDGSFVQVTENNAVYRMVGGAPLYVSDWNAVGGSQTVSPIHQSALDSLPKVPRDGTFINARTASGTEAGSFVIAGGAPVYISSWSVYGGQVPASLVQVDAWDLQNISNPAAHLNAVPADGTFVRDTSTGTMYEIAGGAPLAVSAWSAVGGPHPYVDIDPWDLANITNPAAHLTAVPADGTFINAHKADGTETGSFEIAGGAPIYVSSWSAFGGQPAGIVQIDDWDVENTTNPAAHLNSLPADGTLVSSNATGRVYIIAGGAPTYVSDWAAIGGARPSVGIDQWDLDNITNSLAHMNAVPADNIWLAAGSDGGGWYYVMAGGAPIAMGPMAIFLSEYASISSTAPTVCVVDKWSVDHAGQTDSYMRAAPLDGTIVRGLPSDSYWSFVSGAREATQPDPSAVLVSDVGLASFPVYTPDTTPPTTTVSGADSRWHRHAVTLTFSAGDNPGGSGMSGGQAMTEYRMDTGVWTTGAAVTVPAPLTHADDGLHTVSYRSRDAAGNLETVKSCTVRIDTCGPTTTGKATSGRAKHAISLRYYIYDKLSPEATAVTVYIRDGHGRLVKRLALGNKATHAWYPVRWTPKARGTYTYTVSARDLAGNQQVKAVKAKITVR